MNREDGNGLLLIVLMLTGGLMFTGGPRAVTVDAPTSESSSPVADAANADPLAGEDESDASKLLIDLFAASAESEPPARPPARINDNFVVQASDKATTSMQAASAATGRDTRIAVARQLANDADFTVEFLIATVADPIDSHVRWQFDAQLAAIQRAIERVGHYPDRYFLPWRTEKTSAGAESAEHRHKPGVLVFRARDHVLVLFLVGETPTTGIHKVALASALEFIRAWNDGAASVKSPVAATHFEPPAPSAGVSLLSMAQRQTNGSGDGDRGNATDHGAAFRIIGPTFSGSAFSLRTAIRQWWDAHCHMSPPQGPCDFDIVSGASTGTWIPRVLLRRPTNRGCAGRIRFRSTVVPDDARRQAFVKYFRRLQAPPWPIGTTAEPEKLRIAILNETGTAFGQLAGGGLKVFDGGNCRYESDQAAANLFARKSKPATVGEDWLKLPFPLHISRVRCAHERLNHTKPELPPELSGGRRPMLELSLGEEEHARDVVPPLTPLITSVNDELAMSQMLSTIANEGIQYVGILATDTRDTLFLARQVRTYAPDVQLVAFESDMLLTHPEYSAELEGTLVLSTYPLFNANQRWSTSSASRNERGRLQFASERAQGTFNATLGLLGTLEHHERDDTRPLEYTAPLLADDALRHAQLSRYAAQGNEAPAPLWVSVIGRGGLWPVAYFPVAEAAANAAPELTGALDDAPGAHTTGLLYVHPKNAPAAGLQKADAGVTPVNTRSAGYGAAIASTQDPATGAAAKGGGYGSLETIGNSWRFSDVLFLALALLALSYCLLYAASRFGRRGATLRWELLSMVWREGGCPVCRRSQRACLLASLYALLVVDAVFLAVYRIDWSDTTRAWHSILVFAGGTALLAVVAVICIETARAWVDAGSATSGGQGDACGHEISVATRFRHLRTSARRLVWVACSSFVLLFSAAMIAYLPGSFPELLAERALNFNSGVSPLAVTVFLGSGFFLAALANLRRLRLAVCGLPSTPLDDDTEDSPSDLAVLIRRARAAAESPWRCMSAGRLFVAAVACWLIPWLHLSFRMLPTFEGYVADVSLKWIALPLYIGVVLLGFVQLLGIWARLRAVLRRLATHPLFPAFGRLPSQFAAGSGRLWSTMADASAFELAAAQWAVLANHVRHGKVTSELSAEMPTPPALARAIDDEPGTPVSSATDATAIAARGRRIARILTAVWRASPLPTILARESDATVKLSAGERDTLPLYTTWNVGTELGMWLRLAEEHVALQVTLFLNQQLVQMRNLLGFITVAVLLFLLAINAYPFQPRGLLNLYAVTVFASVAVATVIVLVQTDKDPVLSRIAGTSPNKLDRAIIWPILTFAVLPFLGLLATQFPELAGITSRAEHLLRVVR